MIRVWASRGAGDRKSWIGRWYFVLPIDYESIEDAQLVPGKRMSNPCRGALQGQVLCGPLAKDQRSSLSYETTSLKAGAFLGLQSWKAPAFG